ncbi:glycosyltransferase family 10 domain-containing protein [Pedobacter frigoris]|uniref:glycosyltransferase family 10 domain-containing protein n=1 Tax=Pedobacter frigoris TaxID=2571272 RepID=UPI00292E670D|nr:glycosyltransferase family 10 [Pedobacter frigoris]
MKLKSLFRKLGWYEPSADYTYLPDQYHIEVLNGWTNEAEKLWYHSFVKHHFRNKLTRQKSMLIASVFGPKKLIKKSQSLIKLFYTGENVERYKDYKDHCSDLVDVMVGFDYKDDSAYQRFPYWLEFLFRPEVNAGMIREQWTNLVNKHICPDENKKFTSLVSSHDDGKIRTILFNGLSQIDRVDSGGKYLNNTSSLKDDFNNNKGNFIGHYKFNICPENSNREGYVTEKVFEALRSNTIPIYWGSNNNPEPDVLNKDAILFYDGPESLPALMKQVDELHTNPKLYLEFLNQPKFKPDAAEYIIHQFESLHSKIASAIHAN